MSAFKLKSQLPVSTQNEMDRILAIPAAQRLTSEAAFLTALGTDYLNNAVIAYDSDGLILQASGITVPTGDSGFKKGATFIKTDAVANGLYYNVGTSTASSWQLSDEIETSEIANGAVTEDKIATPIDLTGKVISLAFKSGTPVNAAAASKELTVSGLPNEGDTVTINSQVYKFRAAIGAGAKAAKILTFTGLAVNNNTATLGTDVYTFKTALTEKKAVSTLTLSANETDGNSVTIGTTKYTFKETLGAAYDVKIGASASDTLDNLIAAINKAAGEGSTYGTGTLAHPDVTAAAGAGDTMDITAKVIGTAGNSIATTELSAVSTWTGATMGSGANAVANEILIGVSAEACIDNFVAAVMHTAGEGSTYSTGTVAHTTIDAAKQDADKFVATAKSIGFAGNSIAVAETLDNATWAGGATALSGGVDAEAANDVLIGAGAEATIDNLVLAITAGAGAGTSYGTGTVANTLVTASKKDASTMTATAKTRGIAGNSITIAENATNVAWAAGATSLSGGADGTVGAAREVLVDSSFLYVCTAANSITGQNWRRITLGSAF